MSDEVNAGHEGWLFLTGGSNQALRYYAEPGFLTPGHVAAWVGLLRSRAAHAAGVGARYLHLFAPDKLSVYPEHFAGALPCFDRRPGAAIGHAAREAGLGAHLLDAEGALAEEKSRGPVYYRTDTHWTQAGLLAVYRAICGALGVAPLASLAERPFTEAERALDFGGKLSPPRKERVRDVRILRDARRAGANILVEEAEARGGRGIGGLLSGSHVRYVNDGPEVHDARVVLFGDSYSEWRPLGLTAMLAETFREVAFFWSSSYDARQVERLRPDIVISELPSASSATCPMTRATWRPMRRSGWRRSGRRSRLLPDLRPRPGGAAPAASRAGPHGPLPRSGHVVRGHGPRRAPRPGSGRVPRARRDRSGSGRDRTGRSAFGRAAPLVSRRAGTAAPPAARRR